MSLASGKAVQFCLALRYLEKKTNLCHSLSATWRNPGAGEAKTPPRPCSEVFRHAREDDPTGARAAATCCCWYLLEDPLQTEAAAVRDREKL